MMARDNRMKMRIDRISNQAIMYRLEDLNLYCHGKYKIGFHDMEREIKDIVFNEYASKHPRHVKILGYI